VDLGFVLSFCATLGLMVFNKRISRALSWIPGVVREDLSTTISASLAVWPVLYFAFGEVNFLSPLVNVLVLWTIPVITIFGMIAGVMGLFVPFLGRLILYLIYPLVEWFLFVVGIF
jgi:competence protein ComEC